MGGTVGRVVGELVGDFQFWFRVSSLVLGKVGVPRFGCRCAEIIFFCFPLVTSPSVVQQGGGSTTVVLVWYGMVWYGGTIPYYLWYGTNHHTYRLPSC